MPLKLITGPLKTPVSVSEVMSAFRGDDEAAFTSQATLLIKAMTKHAEARIGRALITQEFELILDAFPCCGSPIDLVLPDVSEIVSVKYRDVSGNAQELAGSAYALAADNIPSALAPAFGSSWPSTRSMIGAVRVGFKAGFGEDPEKVPDDIRTWIIAHVVQVLESPSGMVDQTFRSLPFVDSLLDPYIVYRAM